MPSFAAAQSAAQPPEVDPQSPAPAVSCESLADLTLPGATITAAELVTTGTFEDPKDEGQDQEDLPKFCRVALTVDPQINIEVWLPTDTYNGRFQAVGNGYLAGFIAYDDMANALRDGYATASTDTGHPETGTSGAFALGDDSERNRQLIEDFASRSLFKLTEKSQQLVETFYGGEAEYSYWNGYSTGGRQGLMLAQRLRRRPLRSTSHQLGSFPRRRDVAAGGDEPGSGRPHPDLQTGTRDRGGR